MSAYTKWFMTLQGAPFVPTSFQGSWDDVTNNGWGSFNARRLNFDKGGTAIATLAQPADETVTTNPYHVALSRHVSPKLAAQTISGTVDVKAIVGEGGSADDLYTRVHIYATVGDTDSVRGTLLTYEEGGGGGGTEWPIFAVQKPFASAQTLSSTVLQEGDRLVIEYGYVARNSSSSTARGSVTLGARNTPSTPLSAPLSDANLSYLLFSSAITLSSSEPTNVTPEAATDITSLMDYVEATSLLNAANAELWFTLTPSVEQAISLVSRIESGSAWVAIDMWEASGLHIASGSQAPGQALVLAGTQYYFRALGSASLASAATIDLQYGTLGVTDWRGNYLIIDDDGDNTRPSILIDPDSGLVVGLANIFPAETGVALSDGTLIVPHSNDADQVSFYDQTLALIHTFSGSPLTSDGQANPPAAANVAETHVYVAHGQGDTTIKIIKLNVDTYAVDDQWDITTASGENVAIHIGVSPDESTFYYVSWDADTVRRYDLVNDVPLSDALGGYSAGTDGTVILDFEVTTTGHPVVTLEGIDAIDWYDTDGMTFLRRIDTYIGQGSGFAGVDHTALTGSDSIGVWYQDPITVNGASATYSYFARFRLSTGELISQPSGPTPNFLAGVGPNEAVAETPAARFGPSGSCPLSVAPGTFAEGGGGGGGGGEIIGPLAWVHWPRRVPGAEPPGSP